MTECGFKELADLELLHTETLQPYGAKDVNKLFISSATETLQPYSAKDVNKLFISSATETLQPYSAKDVNKLFISSATRWQSCFHCSIPFPFSQRARCSGVARVFFGCPEPHPPALPITYDNMEI